MSQKGYKFWSDRCIVLNFLHEFPDAIFFMVAMESLLGYEELWSAKLE